MKRYFEPIGHKINRRNKTLQLKQDINTKVKTSEGEPEYIVPKGETRKGNSLCSLLFDKIMNQIWIEEKNKEGYKIVGLKITIVCYANDAVLIADEADDLQRQVHKLVHK